MRPVSSSEGSHSHSKDSRPSSINTKDVKFDDNPVEMDFENSASTIASSTTCPPSSAG